ncbi:MAG: aldo/keto reductase, partial [Gaiellaceae bacterium]
DALMRVADAHGATPAQVALAWLLSLSPEIVPIPGARRPETALSAAGAARLTLTVDERALLAR